MSDELDEEEQMHARKKAFYGRMKRCDYCHMFNTMEGKCPVCGIGKMVPV